VAENLLTEYPANFRSLLKRKNREGFGIYQQTSDDDTTPPLANLGQQCRADAH